MSEREWLHGINSLMMSCAGAARRGPATMLQLTVKPIRLITQGPSAILTVAPGRFRAADIYAARRRGQAQISKLCVSRDGNRARPGTYRRPKK